MTILAYTMPIWAVLLAWPFLGERPNRMQIIALGLCAAGLAVLIYPLADDRRAARHPAGGHDRPVLGGRHGLSEMGAASRPIRWASACWQVTIAFVVMVAFMLVFDGRLAFRTARSSGLFAPGFTGIVGNGVAYGLWFAIMRRLPAVTASLGVLSRAGDRRRRLVYSAGRSADRADIVGFALIFAASACVLLARSAPAEAPSQGHDAVHD